MKVISRFDIAKKVPVDGDISYADLAAAAGVNEDAMCRILRSGITYRGFALANKSTTSFWGEIGKDPERARRFGGAMSCSTRGEGFSLRHLTESYPWGSIGSGTVVDIGGTHGHAAFALARKYPSLHLVVQDLPENVANASPEVDLNVAFMAHDFFEPQLIYHAEVYLFRWIFHDWSDKYCVKILQALIPALQTGSRVLIMDVVLPPFGIVPNSLERKIRLVSLLYLGVSH
ncbi:MAG: hypothetical protein Q9227_004589 [Pyrenula ochraceoflavens]